MKLRPSILRLYVEIVLAIALAEAAVMLVIPVVARGEGGVEWAILDAGLLSLLAGPIILWRMWAAGRRAQRPVDAPGEVHPRRAFVVAGVVFVALALCIAAAVVGANRVVNDEARARFHELSGRMMSEAERRVRQPHYGLLGARAIYAASQNVERAEFAAFVAERDLAREFPGAIGIGFIKHVKRQDLDAFIAAERADGAPDFSVRSLAEPGSPLADATELYIITHCFPKERNGIAWGLDTGSEPVRREAVERAVETGEAAISGRISLVQGYRGRSAFLYMVPIFRNDAHPSTPAERRAALLGLAYAPIVLDEALAGVADASEGQLHLTVFDGEETSRAATLYDCDGHAEVPGATDDQRGSARPEQRMFQTSFPVRVGGHTWTFGIGTTPKFEAAIDRSTPLTIGVGGAIMSLLASGCAFMLTAGRARAMAMAQGMTRELAAAKATAEEALREVSAFRATLDQHSIISVADRHGRIIEANPQFTAISGYRLEELIGQDHRIVNSGVHPKSFWAEVWRTLVAGNAWRGEVCNRTKDGSLYWVDSIIAPFAGADGKIDKFVSVGNDITARKIAEAELARSAASVKSIIDGADLFAWEFCVEEDRFTFVSFEEERLGYSREAWLRPGFWDSVLHPDDREATTRHCMSEIAAGRPHRLSYRMVTAVGGTIHISDYVSAPEQRDGRTIVRGVAADVSDRVEAERRVAESERRLRTIIEAEPECVKLVGPGGELMEMNAAGLAMLEAESVEQVRRLGLVRFVLPEYHRSFAALNQQVLAGGTGSLCFEVIGLRGTRRWLDLRAVPMRDDAGNVTGVLSVTRDITVQRRAQSDLREQAQRLDLTIRSAGLGSWDWDIATGRVEFNDIIQTMLGYEPGEWEPNVRSWSAIVHPDDLAEVKRVLTEHLEGRAEEYRCEHRLRRKDGTWAWVLDTGRVIDRDEQGRALRMLGVHVDIDARMRASETLAAAREAAEAASRAKSAFLANMSHEIRTPLTAILGFADLLREDGTDTLAPEQRAATIDTIRNAGSHLLTVINDILDLSKIEADKMTIENVHTPLVGVLREVERLMRPRAAGKGVALGARLLTPVPEFLISDPTRLRQILMNLVGNAVKFTEAGAVDITAFAAEFEGCERLMIDVEDTGVGMTAEQTRRLFQAFGQADETVTRKHGGTGLGLTICRRLAALMGGDVKLLRTERGRGSCFRLVLPMRAAPGTKMIDRLEAVDQSAAPVTAPGPNSLRGRIILAEDGVDNQRLICLHLRKAGATVEVADNGRIALERIEEAARTGTPFDLLLTDMQMPEMDGYSLARTLRERGNSLAIVALTAHAMAEDRAKCEEAGCDDYATKPIDKATLIATCAAWMGKPGGVKVQSAAA